MFAKADLQIRLHVMKSGAQCEDVFEEMPVRHGNISGYETCSFNSFENTSAVTFWIPFLSEIS